MWPSRIPIIELLPQPQLQPHCFNHNCKKTGAAKQIMLFIPKTCQKKKNQGPTYPLQTSEAAAARRLLMPVSAI